MSHDESSSSSSLDGDYEDAVEIFFEGNQLAEERISDTDHENEDVDEEREDFDIQNSIAHSYIFNENSIDVTNNDEISLDQTHILPYLFLENVVFPGEEVPYSPRCPFWGRLLKAIVSESQFLVIVRSAPSFHGATALEETKVPQTAVVAKILRYNVDQQAHGEVLTQAHFLAVHRCTVLRFQDSHKCAITILPEIVFRPKSALVLPHWAQYCSDEKKAELCSAITGHPYNLCRDITKDHCETLVNYLSQWFSENNMRNILALGIDKFSFWAASNIVMSANDKYDLLCENSTNVRLFKLASSANNRMWGACLCGAYIMDFQNIIKMSSAGIGGIYVNPAGYIHDLITASKLHMCYRVGGYSSEYSWFPGYQWSIMNCSRCERHIGWQFKSDKLNPANFYAVTRTALFPALEASSATADDPESDA